MKNILVKGNALHSLSSMPNDTVNLVLTDIPYGEVNATRFKRIGSFQNLDKGVADKVTFEIDPFIDEMVRVCSGSFYIFCGYKQVSPIVAAFERHGLQGIRVGVWEKTNPAPMNAEKFWLSSVEMYVYAKKPKATFNGRYRSPVLRFPKVNSRRHPTEKPLELFRHIIEVSTKPGDYVLDPCIGSGTTAEAAQATGRQFIGIDMHHGFIDTTLERVVSPKKCRPPTRSSAKTARPLTSVV